MVSLKQLIAISPLLILVLTSIFLLLSISYRRNHLFTFLVTVIGLFISGFSLYFVNNIVPINVTILFHIDKYSIFYIGMVLLSSAFSCFFSYIWLKNNLYNSEEFYLLLIFSTIGCISLLISNHLSLLFVSVELISLPSVGLIAYSFLKSKSLEAAIKYFILSSVISVFMLFGIAIIYSISGNLMFSSVIYESVLMKSCFNIMFLLGFLLIIIAFFFKLSLFPFHVWTPDVYQGVSSEFLIFFSTAVKVAIFSVFFKFISIILSFNCEFLNLLLEIISIISIFFGNIMAVYQSSIKRLLGYSSIAQLGYLLIILVVFNNTQFSLEVTNVYLIGYVISNIGIFGIMSLVSNSISNFDSDLVSSYRSLFWSDPIIAISMTIMFMSLSGIPISIGFIGKFYLIFFMLKENFLLLSSLVLVGMMIGTYAYLKVFSCFYYIPNYNNTINHLDSVVKNTIERKIAVFIIYFLSFLILILGIFPQILTSLVISSRPIWY